MKTKGEPENFAGGSMLLHVCCAPCAAGCLERLTERCTRVELYYSNSNLDSAGEFEKRLAEVEKLAGMFGLPLHVDPYDHASWLERCAPYAAEPEGGRRCAGCFAFNLERAAAKCDALGLDNFATTLTVSPRKRSEVIFSVGGVHPRFSPWNFKKGDGYLRGVRISAASGFYRQSYCGCEFSLASSSQGASSGSSTPPERTPPE